MPYYKIVYNYDEGSLDITKYKENGTKDHKKIKDKTGEIWGEIERFADELIMPEETGLNDDAVLISQEKMEKALLYILHHFMRETCFSIEKIRKQKCKKYNDVSRLMELVLWG